VQGTRRISILVPIVIIADLTTGAISYWLSPAAHEVPVLVWEGLQ